MLARFARLGELNSFQLSSYFEDVTGPVLGAIEALDDAQLAEPQRKEAAVPAPPKKTAKKKPAASSGPAIESSDAVFKISDDPAYVALVDLRTYKPELRGWDYDSLTKKITGEMNAGHLVAWGRRKRTCESA